MGLERSATGKVGCLPVRRNSLLLIVGWAGSSATGPAPLKGGFNPPKTTTQPTLGLGEKLGGDAAPSAGMNEAPTQSKPMLTEKETLDMKPSPAIRDRFGRASRSHHNSSRLEFGLECCRGR